MREAYFAGPYKAQWSDVTIGFLVTKDDDDRILEVTYEDVVGLRDYKLINYIRQKADAFFGGAKNGEG